MANRRFATLLLITLIALASTAQSDSPEGRIVHMLDEVRPFHVVSKSTFDELGWDLPDGGATVQALADAAPGGAFDPRRLETISEQKLGYTANWHEVRYQVYGLDWDIGALHLVPSHSVAELPTLAIVNGGAANWYEFFVDPRNQAGLAQYLAQRVPVLLITIPGNYRHGGWTETDFAERIPAYLLDRDIGRDEAALRNAVFTFRVVSHGVVAVIDKLVSGPVVIMGHSTGGEVQFLLKEALADRLQGLSIGWGTGGPASLQAMREFRGRRSIGDYPHVSRLRARTPEQYAGGYLGPLNPFWDADKSREQIAEEWMAREARRRPQFKQPLQDFEHTSAIDLKDEIAAQIRETLAGNKWHIDASEVIDDLFSTMSSSVSGYRKMIWTTASLDTGHWNDDPQTARELLVAEEFRDANPDAAIRVLLFDVPMTHYGHIERPRQLAGGLLAALRWLTGN